jgi:hypothetical protein
MDGTTTLGGWFRYNPTDANDNASNDHNNRYLNESNKATSYYFGDYKNHKLIDCYFYNKGEKKENYRLGGNQK